MLVRGWQGWPRGPLHLAIGVFDGVHVGHQDLIGRLHDGATRARATAVAATFDPLPIQFFAPGAPPSALTDLAERAALLEVSGATAMIAFTFDDPFASLLAREFAAKVAGSGEVRRVVVGEDFRFGHGREGDVAMLQSVGQEYGFAVEVTPPVMLDGAVVSSTRIRNLLVVGDVTAAAALLGRPYAVGGRIVHGDKRGRALGYPTINVSTPRERLLPRDGIYATRVTVAGRTYGAATSLGVRPTFGGGERALESYLLDFSGDLYGEEATTGFVARIRDELRFESADALVARIAEDVEAVRLALR